LRTGTRADIGQARMTYLQGECLYRRTDYTEEAEESQRQSGVFNDPPAIADIALGNMALRGFAAIAAAAAAPAAPTPFTPSPSPIPFAVAAASPPI